jgi:hypothetical protein
MKQALGISCTMVALVGMAALARAQGPACSGPACSGPACGPTCTVKQPCVEDKVCYHVEITYHKCTKPAKLEWIAKVKEGEVAVPCPHKVPVCVKDPCTGCTHTELVEETVMKKVPTKTIDICPDKCGEEEKVHKCVKIVVNHTPVTVMKELPVFCPAAPCCCGHK